ncbi:hypothetical protein TL16_g03540 [Triparma laevis f. inornata]|uniref:PH domain-containing protein n=1 Tax=Triparma laevis f. inornata TaxID=1714386 RepID=A0A9W7A3C7_9STRA|nr:hypothetical protein TL16_g03540 [Triparma laevis f. inornata]
MKSELSHLLPPTSTVRSVLTSSLNPSASDALILGCTIRKHAASPSGGTHRRRVYFNFEDCTLRVEHLIPLVQSFMSAQKGIYYIYKCYRAKEWRKSRKGKERMTRNKGGTAPYLDERMNDRTLSLVQRGNGESLVATFDTVEEYNLWLEALNCMQACTEQYFSFFFHELEEEQCKKNLMRIGQSNGVWSSLQKKKGKENL